MNRFAVGMLAGLTVSAAGIVLMSDKSLRRKVMNKGEDIIEKAENITDKYMKQQ